MNTLTHSCEQSALMAHAVAQANAHAEGLEQRCRRWRRRATVKRFVVMALLVVAILFVVGSINPALANQTYAMGNLSTDKAVASVHQILINT